jgi:hypothetical protein
MKRKWEGLVRDNAFERRGRGRRVFLLLRFPSSARSSVRSKREVKKVKG